MEWTGLNDLREQFLSFFEQRGHVRLKSASLIPKDDHSLLLINSGMAPLKKYFLGQDKVPGNRAVSCQKCIRTPDIERVGKTSRHATFFEMLGNFSFADYFKEEAIRWSWELVTEVWKIPQDRLYISVFMDDDEAYDLWTKGIGVSDSRMVRLGREDNFWEIGAGPCGPCSELYYDRGEAAGCGDPACAPGCDCDRFVEFWNLVFTQFTSDGGCNYERMLHGNIDTGMGLERIAAILQGVDNLFEVDTIRNIMRRIEKIAHVTYRQDDKTDVSLRIITDHLRSIVFLIGDGVLPSNEGRGYVLRRLLRRAARHGILLGIKEPFLSLAAETVIEENKTVYPELVELASYIHNVIASEEERFLRTVDQGISMLSELIKKTNAAGLSEIEGKDAFSLYDTYGFPLDLTEEILAEHGLTVEKEEFEKLMDQQRTRAREMRKAKSGVGWEEDVFASLELPATHFVGYDSLTAKTDVLLIIEDGRQKESAVQGDDIVLILKETPFYAESGGQIGDHGVVCSETAVLRINDCKKGESGHYLHCGHVEQGVLQLGDTVTASVDQKLREATMRNHTSAHLLQEALREIVGKHIHQSGSYVDSERMRFDFSHFEAVTKEDLFAIESLINQKIMDCLPVDVSVLSIEEAKEKGAIALFGEKYGDTVRVITVKDFSVELCGGTHVSNTGQLGLFKILSESSIAAGIRRIEATTGFGVVQYMYRNEALLQKSAHAFQTTNVAELPDRVLSAVETIREQGKQIEELKRADARAMIDQALSSLHDIDGIDVRVANLIGIEPATLRNISEELRQKHSASFTVMATVYDEKVSIVAAAGSTAVARGLHAGKLVKEIASIVNGSGGGKAELAMAGSKETTSLPNAMEAVFGIVEQALR